MTYHLNNTYAKLTPDTLQNKKIEEIMRYTGGHRTSPLLEVPFKIAANYTYLLILVVFTQQTNYSPGQTIKSTSFVVHRLVRLV